MHVVYASLFLQMTDVITENRESRKEKNPTYGITAMEKSGNSPKGDIHKKRKNKKRAHRLGALFSFSI
jgi:hypothetical protein